MKRTNKLNITEVNNLYKTLRSADVQGLPEYSVFESQLGNAEVRKRLFDILSKDPNLSSVVGSSLEEFESMLLKKKESSQESFPQVSTSISEPSRESLGVTDQPTDQPPDYFSRRVSWAGGPMMNISPETQKEMLSADVLKEAVNRSATGLAYNLLSGERPFKVDRENLGPLQEAMAGLLGLIVDYPLFAGLGAITKLGLRGTTLAGSALIDNAAKMMTKGGTDPKVVKSVTNFLNGKLGQALERTAVSTGTLGEYNAASEYLRERTGEHEGYTIDGKYIEPGWRARSDEVSPKRIWHEFGVGAGLGAGLGVTGELGSVAKEATKGFKGFAGKVLRGAVKPAEFGMETAVFGIGDPLLRGEKLSDITASDIGSAALMVGGMKVAGKVGEKIFKSTKLKDYIVKDKDFKPEEKAKGKFALDLDEKELKDLRVKDVDEAVKKYDSDKALEELNQNKNIPVNTKLKLLYSLRGVRFLGFIEPSKIERKGNVIRSYDEKGNLISEKEYESRAEADQAAVILHENMKNAEMRKRFNSLPKKISWI